ncbi:MAG: nucleotidyltransferase domain-containing protein [Candidatus Aenigmarchaeota archaeon]|nr:nucleotidyltransferase domain-containing protein [Candidatus Aenigmarchaeota archaeon]
MLLKNNSLRIAEWFFKYPGKTYHIREISRMTKLSTTGVVRAIGELKKEGILVSKKERNAELVNPNFEGRFVLSKRLYNIYSLYDSGLIDHIKKIYEEPQAIVLFGSYSNGTDTEKSDIDIAIVCEKEKETNLEKFENLLARKIRIQAIDPKKSDRPFKNSLANGVVLEGFLEVV